MVRTTEYDTRSLTSLKTSNGSFSQALAISQAQLNSNLEYWFGDVPQHGASSGSSGTIDAYYTTPSISLSQAYPSGAKCYIALHNSKQSWANVPDSSGTTTKFALNGLIFVYIVSLKNDTLSPDNKAEYTRVQKWLGVNSTDDFSIEALIMDVSGAKYSEVLTVGNATPPVTKDSTQLANLTSLILAGFKDATDSDSLLLSYTWTTTDPKQISTQPPSFPPTATVFQMYPYLGKGQTTPDEGLGKGDNNCLLYLQMTQKLPLPKDTKLPYTGNFVTDSIPNSLCIGASVFFDSWLIPQLGVLNKAAYVKAQQVTVTFVADPANKNKLTQPQANYVYDQGTLSDKDMAWIPSGRQWKWSRSEPTVQSQPATYNNGKMARIFQAKMNVAISNTISVTTGGDPVVNFTGTTVLNLSSADSDLSGNTISGTCAITNTWTFTATVQSILRGGVELTMQGLGTKPGDMYSVTSQASVSFGKFSAQTTADFTDRIKSYAAVTDVRSAALSLQDKLNNSLKLVLPGSKDFAYSHAMFNNENDLMIVATAT